MECFTENKLITPHHHRAPWSKVKRVSQPLFPTVEEPTDRPEDWELLTSLPLILQPLVSEIAMCQGPVFHDGAGMLGVYVKGCCLAWFPVCLHAYMSEQRKKGQVAHCVLQLFSTYGGYSAENMGRAGWLYHLLLVSILNLSLTFFHPSLLHFLLSAVSLSCFLTLSSYLQLSEDRMILNAREEDPHSVRPVVQMRDASSVQVTG